MVLNIISLRFSIIFLEYQNLTRRAYGSANMIYLIQKKTRQSILNLRSFVNEFETSGYGSHSPTVTLNSIARTLNIIEKRLNSLESTIPLGDSS